MGATPYLITFFVCLATGNENGKIFPPPKSACCSPYQLLFIVTHMHAKHSKCGKRSISPHNKFLLHIELASSPIFLFLAVVITSCINKEFEERKAWLKRGYSPDLLFVVISIQQSNLVNTILSLTLGTMSREGESLSTSLHLCPVQTAPQHGLQSKHPQWWWWWPDRP